MKASTFLACIVYQGKEKCTFVFVAKFEVAAREKQVEEAKRK